MNHSVSRLSSLFASNTRGIISITREFIDQHRGSAVERVLNTRVSINCEWFDQSESISIKAQWLISSFEIELISNEAKSHASGIIDINREWDHHDHHRMNLSVSRLKSWLTSYAAGIIIINRDWDNKHQRRIEAQSLISFFWDQPRVESSTLTAGKSISINHKWDKQ